MSDYLTSPVGAKVRIVFDDDQADPEDYYPWQVDVYRPTGKDSLKSAYHYTEWLHNFQTYEEARAMSAYVVDRAAGLPGDDGGRSSWGWLVDELFRELGIPAEGVAR